MLYSSSFSYEQQFKLAEYCRDGKPRHMQGVSDQRVPHYRRLVFNVVSDSLANSFPLTEGLLGQPKWNELVHQFWSEHKCQSPYLWQMPLEFFYFIQNLGDTQLQATYPFLEELLWFEWLEIFFYLREDNPNPYPLVKGGKMETHALVVNPELSIEIFRYPVFKKSAEQITTQDQSVYYLSVHRQQDEEGNVMYNELSAPMARIVELCQQQPQLMSDAIRQVCQDFSLPVHEETIESVRKFVIHGMDSGIFLGYTQVG